jgi:hypothetical protein
MTCLDRDKWLSDRDKRACLPLHLKFFGEGCWDIGRGVVEILREGCWDNQRGVLLSVPQIYRVDEEDFIYVEFEKNDFILV